MYSKDIDGLMLDERKFQSSFSRFYAMAYALYREYGIQSFCKQPNGIAKGQMGSKTQAS